MADEEARPGETAERQGEPGEAAESKEGEPFSKTVRLRYYGTENIVGIFADQATIQHTPEHFTIAFFQTQLPTTDDENQLLQLEEVQARCVARIVIGPNLMGRMLDAMQKNVAKYNQLAEYIRSHGEPPEFRPGEGE